MSKSQRLKEWVLSIPDEVSIFASPSIPITNAKRKVRHKRSRSVTELPLISEKGRGKRPISYAGQDHSDESLWLLSDENLKQWPAPPNVPSDRRDTVKPDNVSKLTPQWQAIANRCFDKRRLSFASAMGGVNYLQTAHKRDEKRRVSFASTPEVIERPPSVSSAAASLVSSSHSMKDSGWYGERGFSTSNPFDTNEGESSGCSETISPISSDSNPEPLNVGDKRRTPFYGTPNVLILESASYNDDVSSVLSASSNESWETAIEDPEELQTPKQARQMEPRPFQSCHVPIGRLGETAQVQGTKAVKLPRIKPLPPLSPKSTSISSSEYSYDNPAPISNYTQLLRENRDIIDYHASTSNLCQRIQPYVEDNIQPVQGNYKTLDEIAESLGLVDRHSDKEPSEHSSQECSMDQAETRAHIWPRIGLTDVEDAVSFWKSRKRQPPIEELPSAQGLRAARQLAPTDADSIRSYGKSNRIKKRFFWLRLKVKPYRFPRRTSSPREDSVMTSQQPIVPNVAENWPLP